MRVTHVAKGDFLRLVYDDKDAFLARIDASEAFVVDGFYDAGEIRALRRRCFERGLAGEPSWHPLVDGCPDYHRVHDDYPDAYVKAKMHAFYFHGWRPENARLFAYFREIFALKTFLAGYPDGSFLSNIPSRGPIARVNFQNYPRGGGHLLEHVDPTSPFARIQTLVQASAPGEDFRAGGLFARDKPGGERRSLDAETEPGDLLVLSPAVPHGVEAVDPEAAYDWRVDAGKWTILPIIVRPDYPSPDNVKPRQL